MSYCSFDCIYFVWIFNTERRFVVFRHNYQNLREICLFPRYDTFNRATFFALAMSKSFAASFALAMYKGFFSGVYETFLWFR